MYKMAEMFSRAGSLQAYTRSYVERLANIMQTLDLDMLARVAEILLRAQQDRNALYIIGNGGSAATAAHLVNDLVAGAYVEGQPAFRAFSLSDNVSTVTALANDCGYDHIFAHQLKVQLIPGDVVMALSVSGNSPNILRALEFARTRNNTTIGFCGISGGAMVALCDVLLHAETTRDEYGPVEDVFSILGHVLASYLAMKQGKELHH